MIKTRIELKQLCEDGKRLNLLTPERIQLSHKMYRLACNWQSKDKYPRLLFFREAGAYYMARC